MNNDLRNREKEDTQGCFGCFGLCLSISTVIPMGMWLDETFDTGGWVIPVLVNVFWWSMTWLGGVFHDMLERYHQRNR